MRREKGEGRREKGEGRRETGGLKENSKVTYSAFLMSASSFSK